MMSGSTLDIGTQMKQNITQRVHQKNISTWARIPLEGNVYTIIAEVCEQKEGWMLPGGRQQEGLWNALPHVLYVTSGY